MRIQRFASVALTLAIVMFCARAFAWDSICTFFRDNTVPVAQLTNGARGCHGPEAEREGARAAQGRWRDPEHHLDEHRLILRIAMSGEYAGIPDYFSETIRVPVFTSGAALDGGLRSVAALPLTHRGAGDAARYAINDTAYRAFTIDELAQLPDFSYSLWDYALGNETCPVREIRGELMLEQGCHVFKTHMGALNANHFPPASEQWYRYLHRLAVERARACREMRSFAWNSVTPANSLGLLPIVRRAIDARYREFWEQCEVEALSLEAQAQHYLQDSWSSGHMWHRWGSVNLEDFPALVRAPSVSTAVSRLITAELTGIASGIVHGSDSAVFDSCLSGGASGGASCIVGTGDAMCYPGGDALSAVWQGTGHPVAGDMHLHDVIGDVRTMTWTGRSRSDLHAVYALSNVSLPLTPVPQLRPAGEMLLHCSSQSIAMVYDQLSNDETFGAPVHGRRRGSIPLQRGIELGTECFGVLAENRALSVGFSGSESELARESDLLASAQVGEMRGGVLRGISIPDDVENRTSYDLLRAAAIARALALIPEQTRGTGMALLAPPIVTYRECDRLATGILPFEIDSGAYCTSHSSRTWRPPNTVEFAGVGPNSRYVTDVGTPPNVHHVDPPLPWGSLLNPLNILDNTDDSHERQRALVSMFHRAHADLWCAAFRDRAALEALRPPSSGDVVATQRCVEIVRRHVRLGITPSLCGLLAAGVEIDGEGATPTLAAERFCQASVPATVLSCRASSGTPTGCEPVRIDGEQFLVGTASSVLLVSDDGSRFQVRAGPVNIGGAARDIAVAPGGRVFVSTGTTRLVGLQLQSSRGTLSLTEVDLNGDAPGTAASFPGAAFQGLATVRLDGHDWLLAVNGASDVLHVIDLGADDHPTFEPWSDIDLGGDRARSENAWDIAVARDGARAFVSFRGMMGAPGNAIAVVNLLDALVREGPHQAAPRVTGFGVGSRMGAMALSPDGRLLAVTGERQSLCLDQIRNASGSTAVELHVGCDDVWVLRTERLSLPSTGDTPHSALPTDTLVRFGPVRINAPSRPSLIPSAVAWNPTGTRFAWGNYEGPTDWPQSSPMRPAGTLQIASPEGWWSYNAALEGSVTGESVVFSRDGRTLYVGTTQRLFAFPTTNEFWRDRIADPEASLHLAGGSQFGPWYGGCSEPGPCMGGRCPRNCPTGAPEVRAGDLGVGIRVMVRL